MQFLKTEKKAAASLAIVYALRMMGLFMVLPVFTLYADQYDQVTPLLMGVAIGIYGLTQGLLQIPFGMMSDRFGRKRMIAIGLLMFFCGSIVAALADSIYSIILGRALQGMGAIAAVIMALAADLSREEIRLRMMAGIGMSIGFAFMASMVLGPYLAATFGLSGIFWINAVLAILAMLVITFITPNPVQSKFQRDVQMDFSALKSILSNSELLKINVGVLILHWVLAATFIAFPLILRDHLHVAVDQHWKTYSVVFLLSVLAMLPLIIAAEKYRKMKAMMLVAIGLLLLAMLAMNIFEYYLSIAFTLCLFFTSFNFLESVLPSLIAKLAPAGSKGTAMAVFSTFQFMGAFIGGVTGGYLYGSFDLLAVYKLSAGLFLVWLIIVLGMKTPKALSSLSYPLTTEQLDNIAQCHTQLMALKGVDDVSIFIEDKIAYLKIDKKDFSEASLKSI